MSINIEEIKYIAKLSKLNFSNEEIESFTKEFESILDYFSYLNSINLDNVYDNDGYDELVPVVRADKVIMQNNGELFKNTKSMDDTYIKVPKIIE